MSWSCLAKEAVPFMVMVAAETAGVGTTIIFKDASSKGMSKYVFIVYTYALAALFLFPFAFAIFFQRSFHLLPSDKLSFFFTLLLLAAIGVGAQLCGNRGLEISSPTLSSVISNLNPAFTFIFAVLFRMEILDWKISSCRAKIIGTIVSMIGAFVVVLYKGPMLLNPSQKLHLLHLQSLNSDWLLGGFLFSVQYLSYSFWYILMTKAIKMMGADTVVIFLYYTCTTLLSTPICFLLEKDLKAWTLPTETALWAILYSGLIGQSFMMIIHAWALGKKGPVYVSSFRPLTIIIAATLTFILLGDPLYFGSKHTDSKKKKNFEENLPDSRARNGEEEDEHSD